MKPSASPSLLSLMGSPGVHSAAPSLHGQRLAFEAYKPGRRRLRVCLTAPASARLSRVYSFSCGNILNTSFPTRAGASALGAVRPALFFEGIMIRQLRALFRKKVTRRPFAIVQTGEREGVVLWMVEHHG